MRPTEGLVLILAGLAAAFPQYPGTGLTRNGKRAVGGGIQIRADRLRPRPLNKRANQLIPVVVGGAQKTFVPNMVLASVGDVIQFQFSTGNHTVTESSETQACTPLQMTDETAVHSGHIPYVNGQQTVGTFNMVVTKTNPMFIYCATGPHCQEGQVLVINPSNTQQLVNYNKLSSQAAKNVDGLKVNGGSVGQISLNEAAFIPASTPGGAAPGAAGKGTTAAPAAATPAAASGAAPAAAAGTNGTANAAEPAAARK
ncbi:hypothetical protein MCOR25_000196 [Pyricularia grisea]|uniref:Phytocyanin domain-containing protein n=1 Tax=Pyricularia grisea TaxID=148305 RepID=A0A6P8BJI7_PYRGI|nr:uncharacterized protein PgNI_02316 [Pyricularia grisea]KAI6383277.1 hypothetical protein MCOR25_000196 [Pyricularia grisea]TLD16844.1 hypothetical protein PgNI_02316 [Pyricularia grisea]